MIRQAYQLTLNTLAQTVLPLELIVFVTKRCPLRCAHCFIEEFETDPASDLPLAVLEKLAGDLPNLLVLMLTGGEPFLRNDLAEIVEAFFRKAKPEVIALTTSGWFPEKTEDVVERMVHTTRRSGQLSINLSFDGTRETHDLVRRRRGAYDRAMETARLLNPIVRTTNRLAVGANLTLVPDNQDSILTAAQELADTGLFSFLSCNMYREGRPRFAFQKVDLEIYRRLARFVQEYSSGFLMSGHGWLASIHQEKERRQAEVIERMCRTNAYQGVPCEAGRNIGVVQADGSVTACEMLSDSWGNIKQRSIVDIWNDRANRTYSDRLRSSKCFCTHECFISASMNTQVKEVGKSVASLCRRLCKV